MMVEKDIIGSIIVSLIVKMYVETFKTGVIDIKT